MSASDYLPIRRIRSTEKVFAHPLANPLKSVTTSVCEIGDISFANGNMFDSSTQANNNSYSV